MAKVVIFPKGDRSHWEPLIGTGDPVIVKDSDDNEMFYASFNDAYAAQIEELKTENTVVIDANLTDNRPLKATIEAGYTFPPVDSPGGPDGL